MKRRFLQTTIGLALVACALVVVLAVPAGAELRRVPVKLPSGEIVTVTVDVPAGTSPEAIEVPGLPGGEVVGPGTPVGGSSSPSQDGGQGDGSGGGTTEQPSGDEDAKKEGEGKERERSKKKKETSRRGKSRRGKSRSKVEGRRHRTGGMRPRRNSRLRNSDGSPTRRNPGFFEATPGPAQITGVPNFAIREFQVPVFLLSIYQAAGIEYGIRWEVLAAINKVETNFGRNLNVSSAGALGWMQFMPASWRAYGVDANGDGRKDPYSPVDAIFAAARYLKAAGGDKNLRRAIFAYNHADWYVDLVMMHARMIAGYPPDMINSLTGLTQARFPVYAKAHYADDITEREARKRFRRGQNAANVVESEENRKGIEIYARKGAPAIAVNDGVIKKIGHSKRLGRFVILQDSFGNRFTYAGLARVSRLYPVPRRETEDEDIQARAISARDGKPAMPASAGRPTKQRVSLGTDSVPRPKVVVKRRLFAHPDRPGARLAGGLDQILESQLDGFTTFRNYFSKAFGLGSEDVKLKRLRRGSRVMGGTILGRVGQPDKSKASHLYFEVRPAGQRAPRIDPKPLLDGWKLLEATAIYRASGKNVLNSNRSLSIGQILLLPKQQLERKVLNDNRIEVYPCGRNDIRTGQIDRRPLAMLAYLADAGFRPTVTSLKCGHSYYTASGGVSHHSSGNAADIAKINGIPIYGHQERGGITHQTVKRLMMLQGTMRPDQIISLLDLGANTIAMGDHADHIHVGWRPLFGSNRRLGRQTLAVMKGGQWHELVKRLGQIDNPVVPLRPSKYSIPVRKRRHSHAHRGE